MLQFLGIPVILLITRSQQSMCYQCRSATTLSVDIIFSDLSDPSVSFRQATSPHTPRVSTRTPWRNHKDTPPRTPWLNITSCQWNTMKPWKLLHWGSWIFHTIVPCHKQITQVPGLFCKVRLGPPQKSHHFPRLSSIPESQFAWKLLWYTRPLAPWNLPFFVGSQGGTQPTNQVKPPKPWGRRTSQPLILELLVNVASKLKLLDLQENGSPQKKSKKLRWYSPTTNCAGNRKPRSLPNNLSWPRTLQTQNLSKTLPRTFNLTQRLSGITCQTFKETPTCVMILLGSTWVTSKRVYYHTGEGDLKIN